MSQVVDASEIRELAAGIERQQVMDIVRGATFVGTLLLGWISLHPFESLGDMQIGDVGTGNELATYAMFGALSVLTIALAMRNDARGLATLLSPAFVLFGSHACSVSRCHTKRIDALWLEFHGGANLSHMRG
jgi:hypothetical protein